MNLNELRKKLENINDRRATVDGRTKEIKINSNEALSRWDKLYGSNREILLKKLRDHISFLERYIPFSSSPQSFKAAWEIRSDELTLSDSELVVSLGGQLIPEIKDSAVFVKNQKGLMISPIHDGLLFGVRHSDGNYDDHLDDLGKFFYQPPEDLLGILRYRFYESFSNETKVPLVLFISMWFGFNNSLEEGEKENHPREIDWVYIICPVKVISSYGVDENNLTRPLQLQLISRNEALELCNQIKNKCTEQKDLQFRPNLTMSVEKEFSYEHIKSSKKGKAIKKWAKENSKSCPGCEKSFTEFSDSNITFGHIISQNWCESFSFLASKVHNPDNLYLTCKSCNSSLNKYFPEKELQNKITLNGYGTIGDWLRNHIDEIRKLAG